MITHRAAPGLLAAPAFAQGFPERAVRYAVPFTPAGLTDIMARIIEAGVDLETKPAGAPRAFMEAEVARWGLLVREAGIRADG